MPEIQNITPNDVGSVPSGITNTPAEPQPTMDMWNSKMRFPKNKYILRVNDAKYSLSKEKQNPMIELQAEIVGPKSSVTIKQVNAQTGETTVQTVGIIGLNVSMWVVLTDNARQYVRDLHKAMGFGPIEPNPNSPELQIYKGIILNGIIECETSPELSDDLDEVTGKQIPITDDEGKPIIRYRLKWKDIISRNTTFTPLQPS